MDGVELMKVKYFIIVVKLGDLNFWINIIIEWLNVVIFDLLIKIVILLK